MESECVRQEFDLAAYRSRPKLAILAATCLAVGLLGQTSAWADSADEALARVQRSSGGKLPAIKQENEALRRVNKLRGENAALVKQTASHNAGMAVGGNPREADAADSTHRRPGRRADRTGPDEGLGRRRSQLVRWRSGRQFLHAFDDPIVHIGDHHRSGVVSTLAKSRLGAATGFDYRFAGSPWHVSGSNSVTVRDG